MIFSTKNPQTLELFCLSVVPLGPDTSCFLMQRGNNPILLFPNPEAGPPSNREEEIKMEGDGYPFILDKRSCQRTRNECDTRDEESSETMAGRVAWSSRRGASGVELAAWS